MTGMSALVGPAVATAYDFGKWGSLMDVGGGNGMLLAAILKAHPELRGVLADLPHTLERATHRGFLDGELASGAPCSLVISSVKSGLVPLEDSSGNRRRLGHITKQGSSMLRFLLVEAAQVTVRSVPEWRSKYLHLMDAARTEDCQGRHGAPTSGSSVLDDAPGMGLSAVEQARFARGTARTSRWCAVKHRVIDWASRSSSARSSK